MHVGREKHDRPSQSSLYSAKALVGGEKVVLFCALF